jgi:hypothetical protein
LSASPFTGALLPLGAQLGAEVRTRLRSAGTLFALAFILVGSTLWMPDPRGKTSSISWEDAANVVSTPAYTARYVSVATAILTSIFLALVAFYLVAGSVRRDRETGVGAILAGTPLGKTAYLAGKLAANAAYLGLISLLILAVGMAKQLALGQGPLEPGRFAALWLVTCVPGILFVAACALLFDTAPGLRGRGGLVVWFFASIFVLIALPMILHGDGHGTGLPFFDPVGTATISTLIERSLPAGAHGVSTGLIYREGPLARVPWSGIELTAGTVGMRLGSMLWAALPFLLAVRLFDRFDPARGESRQAARRPINKSMAAPLPESAPAPAFPLSALPAAHARPRVLGALLAETRLIWDSAPLLRWPLLAASVAGAFLAGEAAGFAAAAFLLLLVPVISEAGARESLAGAEGLVFSQPSLPRSAALWKNGSVALFVFAAAAPLLLRSLASPARFVALVTGLAFVSAFAASAALVTGGGKLFSGVALALWYAAVNRMPVADFCGIFGGGLEAGVRAGYVAAGTAFLAMALIAERWRSSGQR